MKANTTMTRDVIVVAPELPIDAAWRIMRAHHIRHLPVVRAGALIGILSDRDLMTYGTRAKDGALHFHAGMVVAEVMTLAPMKTCEETTDVSDLARLMVEEKIDAVPVVRGLRLIGLITSSDLLELLIRRDEARPLPFDFRIVDDTPAYA